MKRSGPLSNSAFNSFAAGFEGRAVQGMQAENTRYTRPGDLKRLVAAGVLAPIPPKGVEGVLCHYVRLRNRKGDLSRRMHSLLALFLEDGRIKLHVLPTDWFLAGAFGAMDEDGGGAGSGAGGDDEKPKLKECTYDICMTRGQVSTCESNTISIPEAESCPDANSGCPNSPCSGGGGAGGGGAGGFDISVILSA